MKTIYKFDVEPEFSINLPLDAVVLTVQMQNGSPKMWVYLDTEEPDVSRTFHVFGTGHDMGDYNGRYIGTFQTEGLVFHVFEDLPESRF